MQRIAIIGSPGSGKSTLARALGERLGLPLHHLDRLYWRPGWQATPKAEFIAMQLQQVRHDRWIFDGNYGSTMPIRLAAADTIIFLDLPAWLCIKRVLARSLLRRERPDMARGCPERFLRWEYAQFLLYIARFHRRHRPAILEQLSELDQDKTVHHLRSPTTIAHFLKETL